mgnify:CR=1 FL=1
MTIGVFHIAVGPTVHLQLAANLIASVRRTMPGVPIAHLTDQETAPLADVDFVIRHTSRPPVALGCLDAYAHAGPGDWLFLDTDVVVQRDVRPVFDLAFDVAVATREGTLRPNEIGTKFMARMPFNKGAVFSRCAEFWGDAVRACLTMPAKRQQWMGDQLAMNEVIDGGRYRVVVLPNTYNYPPKTRGDVDARSKAILHFKGNRKAWALEAAA